MKKLLVAALAVAAGVVGPAAAFAQTFAYVDQNGDVRTVEADTAMNALMTAPSIDENSGVMLLDSAEDTQVVGDDVSGV